MRHIINGMILTRNSLHAYISNSLTFKFIYLYFFVYLTRKSYLYIVNSIAR